MSTAPDFVNVVATGGDDFKFNFQRYEMYKSSLAGIVGSSYDRYVFLCFKSPDFWPSRVEDFDSDLLPKFFSSAIKSRKNDINVKILLQPRLSKSSGDLVLFGYFSSSGVLILIPAT
ncbi:uncharacterized protein LOC131165647 [Malania oleifera]|uniref:uncharacterized protein LOC131165647 n=1 Tax=Malania oleifera TaxID=397392 RepID=UPI0025ADD583|nr:uncharacterized protein LOC131165647 [Malania oleifera]